MPGTMGAVGQGAAAGAASGGSVGGWWGALGGGILGGLGGLFSANSGPDHSNYVKHRIQMLVNDAKAAGVHPLYALGASAGYSPTLSAGDPTAVSRAISAAGSMGGERAAHAAAGLSPVDQAQMEALHAAADRDTAAAEYSRWQISEDKRRLLEKQASYTVTPDTVTAARAGDASVTAAPPGPSLKEYNTPLGPVKVPAQGSQADFVTQIVLGALGWGQKAVELGHQSYQYRFYKWLKDNFSLQNALKNAKPRP